MRFGIFVYILCLLTITACQSDPASQTTSSWDTLKTAQKAECFSWPKPPKDLDVSEVVPITGTVKGGFLALGRARNTKPIQYYTDFAGTGAFEAEDLKLLNWGNKTQFAGMIPGGQKSYAVTERVVNGKPQIEIRESHSGKVITSIQHSLGEVEHLRVHPGTDGFWFLFKRMIEETSVEDTPAEVAFVTLPRRGTAASIRVFPDVKIYGQPMFLALPSKKDVLVAWLDSGTSEKAKKPEFKLQSFNQSGPVAAETSLKMSATEDPSNWAMEQFGPNHLLAYVDGDSLMGSANLKVALFKWDRGIAKIKWIKTKSLANEHAAYPVLSVRGPQAHVFILKWLDKESTVAAYKVTQEDVTAIGTFGVFPEGTMLKEAFVPAQGKQPHAILRARKGAMQQYTVCRFDGL